MWGFLFTEFQLLIVSRVVQQYFQDIQESVMHLFICVFIFFDKWYLVYICIRLYTISDNGLDFCSCRIWFVKIPM